MTHKALLANTMTNQDTVSEPGGETPKQKKRSSVGRRPLIIGVLLLVVVVALIAYGANRTIKNNDAGNQESISLEETVKQAESLVSARKYDEAVAVWNRYDESTDEPDAAINTSLGIATVYMNKQDFAAALEQYKKAEQLVGTPSLRIINGIINIAQMTNDKALEIEYSRKAIEALVPNHPLYQTEKEAYERRIEALNAELN